MPITKEITLYTFDELNNNAKDRARDWYRATIDYDWWEYIYDDFVAVAERMGLAVVSKSITFDLGRGSFAAFEGRYIPQPVGKAPKRVREYAPLDEDLHAIVDELEKAQDMCAYNAYARTTPYGRSSMAVEVEMFDEEGCPVMDDVRDKVESALHDLANWLLKQLRAEYESMMDEENVDENILANGYTFDERGRRED
jgi:hypothetical protein